MDNQQSNAAGIRPELPPTKATYFYQAKGEPNIDRVIFALQGVCDTMDQEQLKIDDWDQLCRISNLATAAAILVDQLADRITSGPHPAPRRKPRLRAVPAGVPGGAA